MNDDAQQPVRLSVPAQFMIGVLLGLGTATLMVVLALLGVQINLVGWIGVFLSIWICVYVAMRRRWIALIAAFVLSAGTLQLILAAREYRLWW